MEHEAEHLREIAKEGESAATLLILIGICIAVASLLVALVVALTLVVADLVTH